MACNRTDDRGWRGWYADGACYRILPTDNTLATYADMERDNGFKDICGQMEISGEISYQGHLAQTLTQKLIKDLQHAFSRQMASTLPVNEHFNEINEHLVSH